MTPSKDTLRNSHVQSNFMKVFEDLKKRQGDDDKRY